MYVISLFKKVISLKIKNKNFFFSSEQSLSYLRISAAAETKKNQNI